MPQMYFINSILKDVSILHPLKTLENLRFSGVLRGYKNMSIKNVNIGQK